MRFVGIGLVLVLGCGGSLPALSESPQFPAPPYDEDVQVRSAREHRNKELSALHEQCEDKRIALQKDVDDSKDSTTTAAVAATGAMMAGMAASDTDNQQNAPEPDALKRPQSSGQSVAVGASRDAKGQIQNINRMLDDLSGFVYANPEVEKWTDEEHALYDDLVTRLRSACRP